KGKKGERAPAGGVTVLRGTVERFTTAPKGEIDGFLMDDGTWGHWPPHLEGQAKGVFGKGDRVRVTGWWEAGKKGESKLEAQPAVNLRTDKSVLFDYRQGAIPSAGLGAGASREERLRALERRLEDLLREIKELRRDR